MFDVRLVDFLTQVHVLSNHFSKLQVLKIHGYRSRYTCLAFDDAPQSKIDVCDVPFGHSAERSKEVWGLGDAYISVDEGANHQIPRTVAGEQRANRWKFEVGGGYRKASIAFNEAERLLVYVQNALIAIDTVQVFDEADVKVC